MLQSRAAFTPATAEGSENRDDTPVPLGAQGIIFTQSEILLNQFDAEDVLIADYDAELWEKNVSGGNP